MCSHAIRILRTLCVVLFAAQSAATLAFDHKNSTPISPADLQFFEQKVRPLLVEKCLECHAGGPKGAKGGLRLDSRGALLAGGDTGPAVTPGKPEESLLIEAISYGNESLQMPPRGKLSAHEIELLTEWIRRGASFPGGSPESETPHRAGIDVEAGRKFWSFQPVREHPLPVVAGQDWPRQRLDAFVLARLAQAGLATSPEADRRTLLRRLTFDLTGLPPSLAEIEEFESDQSPDAYDRRVTTLLSSPRYGERWARFWLDLVRYADTIEVWAQDKQAKAWLYRDWVISALNSDVGYDRFLELQLAADQVPDVAPSDLAALGFLGLSPSYWKELKLDPSVIKSVVAEEWEERIQMISGTILGLTVACARCHDHKQDPIGMDDYYALAGILASTRITQRSLLPDRDAAVAAHVREELETLTKARDELKKQQPQTVELERQADELTARLTAREQATPQLSAPVAYALEDASLLVLPDGPDRTKLEYRRGESQNVAMQIRGNPANLGPLVERRFLRVLSGENAPATFQHGSGRRELAQSFATSAAPLTARVIVNRVWRQHFGQGLVETPSNFGSTGSAPTHPELLDDLAARFIANGWSLKWLHRELLLSATYRQSSAAKPEALAIDPDNHLLWRMPRRRLEVEAWRDSMLVVIGRLRTELGGPDRSLDDSTNDRRTLYGNVKRRELNSLLRLHDFPDPTQHTSHRDVTTTPLQQLFVLNSPLMIEMAQRLAARVIADAPGDIDRQVQHAWSLLFGRLPTDRERQRAREFLQSGPMGSTPESLWPALSQALLGSNEFAYLD